MSERSERNPGITSPVNYRAREAGDRIVPLQGAESFLTDPGAARCALGPGYYIPLLRSWLSIATLDASN